MKYTAYVKMIDGNPNTIRIEGQDKICLSKKIEEMVMKAILYTEGNGGKIWINNEDGETVYRASIHISQNLKPYIIKRK